MLPLKTTSSAILWDRGELLGGNTMEWHYDLTGAEPIIKDEPLYDSATIAKGELVMLGGTDPDSGNDEGTSFVTAYSATSANSAVDALGICIETLDTSSSPSIASDYSTTTGPCYGKCIINPFAVYKAEHSLAAAHDQAITSTSSTTVTIGTLADDIDGFWVYFPLTQSGVKGSLRLLTASASGSATMDSALNTAGTSSDTAVLISPPNHYAFNLDTTATKIDSSNCQAVDEATNIRVVQTYIDRDAGLEVMRPNEHYALDDLDKVKGGNGPKFYYDIVLKDHIFGAQE